MKHKDYNKNTNYIIYDDGKIYSKKRGIFLKPSIDRKGYQIVTLSLKGKQTTKRVHRIVAETFIPNPDNKPQVNHIDKNKENNNVNNLEWVTNSENMIHAFKEKKLDEKELREKRKSNCTTIEKYIRKCYKRFYVNVNGNYLGTFGTLQEAQKVKEKYLNKKGV